MASGIESERVESLPESLFAEQPQWTRPAHLGHELAGSRSVSVEKPAGGGHRGNVASSRTWKLVKGSALCPHPHHGLEDRSHLEESSGEVPKPPNCTSKVLR